MGIEFGKGNRKDTQKIDEAMSLIKTWVKPDELEYDKKTECLSFKIRSREGRPNSFYIFNIDHISRRDPEMLAIYTSRGSTIFIHSSGDVSVMID